MCIVLIRDIHQWGARLNVFFYEYRDSNIKIPVLLLGLVLRFLKYQLDIKTCINTFRAPIPLIKTDIKILKTKSFNWDMYWDSNFSGIPVIETVARFAAQLETLVIIAVYHCTMQKSFYKNPAYGRQRISQPMRRVGPIQFWRGCVIYIYIYIFFI